MAKDPAFLFYPGDWLGGTMTFNRHHKGAYIDLLMAQFNSGPLSHEDVKDVLKEDYATMWEQKLKPKFKTDADGKFFNQKLFEEQSKRKSFSESRRNNLKSEIHTDSHMKPHMSKHMVIVNEIVNDNKIYNESSNEFKKAFFEFMMYRIEIKKPYKSTKSLEGQINELKKFNDATAIAMINQSINNQWQGIFPLKNITQNDKTIRADFKPGGPGKL